MRADRIPRITRELSRCRRLGGLQEAREKYSTAFRPSLSRPVPSSTLGRPNLDRQR